MDRMAPGQLEHLTQARLRQAPVQIPRETRRVVAVVFEHGRQLHFVFRKQLEPLRRRVDMPEFASRDPRTVAPVLAILDELRSSPDNLQVSEAELAAQPARLRFKRMALAPLKRWM